MTYFLKICQKGFNGLILYQFVLESPGPGSPGKHGPKVGDEDNRTIQRYVRQFFASFMGYGWVLGKWFMGPFRSLPTLGLLMFFSSCTVTSQKSWKAWTKSKRRTQSRDSAILAMQLVAAS